MLNFRLLQPRKSLIASNVSLCITILVSLSVPADDTWQQAPVPEWGHRSSPAVVVHKGELWLMGGAEPQPYPEPFIPYNDVWKSSDGLSWTRVLEHAPWSPRSGASVVSYKGKILLATTDDLWISEDGMNWTEDERERTWRGTFLRVNDDLYVYGNREFWKTSDGENWSYVAGRPDGYANLTAVAAHNNKIYWLFASAFGGEPNHVLESPQALNWTLLTTSVPFRSIRPGASFPSYKGKLWNIGGGDYEEAWFSTISATEDGQTWTSQGSIPATPRAGQRAIAFNGKLFMIGGYLPLYGPNGPPDDFVWYLDLSSEGEPDGAVEGEGDPEGSEEGEAEGEPGARHSADANGDGQIELSEMLRVIQLFRLGSLHCADGTEDGFAAGAGDTSCDPHHGDYAPQDWTLSLAELLRVIQLYASGGYAACLAGEDGFCLGK